MLYKFTEFQLDTGARKLLRGGAVVPLTPKEFQTLHLLVDAQGRALEREFIMESVWPDTVVGDSSLGRNISVLRRHLGSEAIESVPRFGYRFGLPVAVCDGPAPATGAPEPQDAIATHDEEAITREQSLAKPALKEQSGPPFWNVISTRAALRGVVGLGIVLAAVSVAAKIGVGRRIAAREAAAGAAAKDLGTQRLAVLPFRNISANAAGSDYLRDGMAEVLTARLGELNLPHLQVLARSTTGQYLNTSKPAAVIAAETGAQYLLEGSVRFDDNQARVTTYLVDAKSQTIVWSQVQERPLRELPSIQEEISNRIAQNPVFAGPEFSSRGHAPHEDGAAEALPEAHDEYLRGRFELSQDRRDSYQRALTHFEQAVKLDPGFARGYAGIAEAYIFMTDSLPLTFCYAKAHDAILSALQLDQSVSDAHRDLAWLQMYERNDPAGAEAEFRRALELNPDDARTHHWYATMLSDLRRYNEAVKEASIGYELDPRSAHSAASYGAILVEAGDVDHGKQMLDLALKLDPEYEAAWGYMGRAYLRMRKFDESAAAYNHAASLENFSASYLADAAYARAKSGDTSDAVKLLHLLEQKTARREWFPAQAMAMTQIAVGNKAEARQWLQKAVDDHTVTIFELNHEPFYTELKGQPGLPLVAVSQ
jgi:TolB-like protein/DNA-binding winged helix-turn-helix (wHTH) protein/Tfp pilus assembly protein PilF